MKKVTENMLLEGYNGVTIALDKISDLGKLRVFWSYRGENGAAVNFRKDAEYILIEEASDEHLRTLVIKLGKRFSKSARAGMVQVEKDILGLYEELGLVE